jgi:hypothetical protein
MTKSGFDITIRLKIIKSSYDLLDQFIFEIF